MKTIAARSACAIIAAMSFAAAPAIASEVSFSYAKRDLASSSAITDLYDRIAEKADSACDIYQNSGLLAVNYRRACAAELTDELVANVDHPQLTALHVERNRRYADNR